MKDYEGLFIFKISMKEEDISNVLDKIQDEVMNLDGSMQGTDTIGKRSFARILKKEDAGQYVRARFKLNPEKIGSLLARFKLNEDVFRVQIIVHDAAKDARLAESKRKRMRPEPVAPVKPAAPAAPATESK